LQYSRARFYDAKLGRFISEDPIGFAGGDVNLYGYVRNNPANFKDPTGKIILPVLIVGGAIAAKGIFHLYLGSVAGKIPWNNGDGYGRKKHCWVNYISTRVHLGSPMIVNAAGVANEGVNILQYLKSYISNVNSQEFGEKVLESMGDMRANQQGQARAFII
jgi:uncharacterized protein RhaS with RHS repeats